MSERLFDVDTRKACSEDGCGRSVHARGWCRMHYLRWQRNGEPRIRRLLDADVEKRLLLNIRKRSEPDGCWEWVGSKEREGYGHLRYGGPVRKAHRVAYEVWVGPIPEGLTLDHLCHNTSCVRPDHLEPVTRGENTLRGDSFSARNARRMTCPRGHDYDITRRIGARRCSVCLRRNALERRQRGPGPNVTHGLIGTYTNYGCRCDACVAGARAYWARKREKRRAS